MTQSTTMTIHLESELKSRLDKLSESTHRSKSYLAAEAGDFATQHERNKST